MTGNNKKQIRRLVGSTIAILLICGANTFALQDKISPLSDYMYKKDLPRYEAIKKEADTQKRSELLLDFIKDRRVSRLLLYVATDYQECVKPYLEKKDWAKVISMEEALQAILPTEESVRAAEKAGDIPVGVDDFIKQHLRPTNLMIQKAILAAYYGSNNLPKAAETAEKIYAAAPDTAMLSLLSEIYMKMKNYDKYLVYAEKLLEKTPIDKGGYSIALQMAQIYIQKQNINAASKLFTKILDVYGDAVPPNVPEAQWNATRAYAYGVLAAGAYEKKDYAKALDLYEKVAKFDPKRDDAYYYIGMCKWRTEGSEAAVAGFAKCAVLNKTLAQKAEKHLEDIYTALKKPLEELNQVKAKAKSDLGI